MAIKPQLLWRAFAAFNLTLNRVNFLAGYPLQLFKAGGQIHFFMKNSRDDHAILPIGLIGNIAMLNQINRKFGALRQGATVGGMQPLMIVGDMLQTRQNLNAIPGRLLGTPY